MIKSIRSRMVSLANSDVLNDLECHAELDSHADTCAFGRHCHVLQDWNATVSVDPFLPSLGSASDVKIVTAAVVYECPVAGHPYLLRFHQVLHVPEMERHLLCPFQMRMNGIKVNDEPKFMSGSEKTHLIEAPDDGLVIHLKLNGVASAFVVRKPTACEATSGIFPVVDMTAGSPI